MNKPSNARVLRRAGTLALSALIAWTIAGCASVKDQYAASADAQQRAAAELAADAKAGATVDTQATYLKLVDQMQKEDLWFASLAHIDALEQRWGISPESTRVRADALRQTGQAVLAEAAYKHLLTTPLESAGYRGLGLLAGARGSYAEAAQLLGQAQRRSPTDALLLSDLGYANLKAGRLEDARLPLMQALQLRPDSAQAQANLALYLEVTNQQDQARALMDANRMPEATRRAVREAAQQIRVLPPSPGPIAVFPSAIAEPATTPLTLKRSRWSGTGGPMQATASVVEAPLTLNSPSRGTP
ncbi:hypothetical protein [Acidovorax cavernicola]|uniref:Tetratricopeptide repeat protein n=1 Tax=Acidovorax cavernicola TaxID=1675792 RepID=A0A9X8D8C3_9BURK|nr:hypothetical protein [Acidovorax cavernicola]RIX84006.1 hypothetical protein D3H34_04600 [Acidovorax cavernicola]